MKFGLFLCCCGCVALCVGCAESNPATTSTPIEPTASQETTVTGQAAGETARDETSGTKIELTPANTSIEFIGNHTGDDPKPRHGSFQEFRGIVVVDGTLQAVMVDIETASLSTEIDKLTNHLKNADFFDVNQFPKASFQSTEIKDNGDGTVEITGDFTLLGNTHSITFPATAGFEDGLKLQAEFEIDRTRWGMNYGPDRVEKQVPMKITVGG